MMWFIDSADPIADIRKGLVNDPIQAKTLATLMFPDSTLVSTGETSLAATTESDDDELFAGVYGRLAVLSGPALGTDLPSSIPDTTVRVRPSEVVTYLHADPTTALGVFARWENGELRRSFSATPVSIHEDNGLPFVFERGFWAGEHPLRYADGVPRDPQALPFHPQEFAEQATRDWLGFRFTRPLADTDTDPASIPVTGFLVRPKGYTPTPDDVRHHPAPIEPTPIDITGPARVMGDQPTSAPRSPHPGADVAPAGDTSHTGDTPSAAQEFDPPAPTPAPTPEWSWNAGTGITDPHRMDRQPADDLSDHGSSSVPDTTNAAPDDQPHSGSPSGGDPNTSERRYDETPGDQPQYEPVGGDQPHADQSPANPPHTDQPHSEHETTGSKIARWFGFGTHTPRR